MQRARLRLISVSPEFHRLRDDNFPRIGIVVIQYIWRRQRTREMPKDLNLADKLYQLGALFFGNII